MTRILQPVWYLLRKEFRQIFRDPNMLRIMFLMPMIQLFIFGYAANMDLKHVRLSVLDMDRTPESRHLAESFFTSDVFERMPDAGSPQRMEKAIFEGATEMTVWIPNGYASNLASGRQTQISIAVDGQNSNLAGRAAGNAQAVVRREAQHYADDMLLKRPDLRQKLHRIVPVSRYFYNPELESRYYMIPAIVVLIITIMSTLLTSMAVVREKEIGTLEQLLVTPITPLQLVAGKTIPFVILAFGELTFATTVAKFWFKLPLVGSVPLLAFGALIYLMVTLGGGLLASTVSRTQQQAMFTIWFFMMFGILTSGFFVPVENMPRAVQILTYANPLRYFVTIVRGIFLKGSTLSDLAPQLITLAGIGLLTFTAAVLRFRKRMA